MYKGKTVLTQNNIIVKGPLDPEVVKGICSTLLIVGCIMALVVMVLCM